MDFSNASHGVSFTGMRQYKEDIHMQVFEALKQYLRDTSAIANAVKQGWVGTAADNFIANVQTGATRMEETIDQIQQTLDTELDGIQSQIADMDANLVEKE